jgi:hypothetical protein
MTNNTTDWRLKQIIENIIAVADERLQEESSPYVNGELIGYAESLTIIQEQLSADERKQYGLDFDIDKKYM